MWRADQEHKGKGELQWDNVSAWAALPGEGLFWSVLPGSPRAPQVLGVLLSFAPMPLAWIHPLSSLGCSEPPSLATLQVLSLDLSPGVSSDPNFLPLAP